MLDQFLALLPEGSKTPWSWSQTNLQAFRVGLILKDNCNWFVAWNSIDYVLFTRTSRRREGVPCGDGLRSVLSCQESRVLLYDCIDCMDLQMVICVRKFLFCVLQLNFFFRFQFGYPESALFLDRSITSSLARSLISRSEPTTASKFRAWLLHPNNFTMTGSAPQWAWSQAIPIVSSLA
jgi:hypothetical protein